MGDFFHKAFLNRGLGSFWFLQNWVCFAKSYVVARDPWLVARDSREGCLGSELDGGWMGPNSAAKILSRNSAKCPELPSK